MAAMLQSSLQDLKVKQIDAKRKTRALFGEGLEPSVFFDEIAGCTFWGWVGAGAISSKKTDVSNPPQKSARNLACSKLVLFVLGF